MTFHVIWLHAIQYHPFDCSTKSSDSSWHEVFAVVDLMQFLTSAEVKLSVLCAWCKFGRQYAVMMSCPMPL